MQRKKRWFLVPAFLLVLSAGLVLTACGDENGTEGDADADEVSPDPQPDTDVPPDTPGDPDVTTDPDVGDPPEDPVEEDAAPDPDAVEDAVDEDAAEDPVEEDVTECDDPLIYHPGFDACVSTEGQGRNCADGTACEQGQECVLYYGIAGNPIYECHIECGPTPDRLCPAGYTCHDIADGPQNVCMDW